MPAIILGALIGFVNGGTLHAAAVGALWGFVFAVVVSVFFD